MSEQRERIFNLPPVVARVLTGLLAIQLVIELGPAGLVSVLIERFAFVPARLTFLFAPDAVLRALSNEAASEAEARLAMILSEANWAWITPVSYALLHGNWTHLAVNGLTLAAFGSPLARRIGTARFIVFLVVCAIAGALAHLLAHPFEATPVIGASAAISGTMAAVARFAFASGSRFGDREVPERQIENAQWSTPSLASLAGNQRAMFFLAAWFFVNLLIGAFPQVGGASVVIAWEAHIGGFLAGLLLFGFFDRRPPRAAPWRGGMGGPR